MSDSRQRTREPRHRLPKRRRDAAEKGDVLQSRELGTALVVMVGAAWIAFAGPMMVGALQNVLGQGLTFNAADLRDFDPGSAIAAAARHRRPALASACSP